MSITLDNTVRNSTDPDHWFYGTEWVHSTTPAGSNMDNTPSTSQRLWELQPSGNHQTLTTSQSTETTSTNTYPILQSPIRNLS